MVLGDSGQGRGKTLSPALSQILTSSSPSKPGKKKKNSHTPRHMGTPMWEVMRATDLSHMVLVTVTEVTCHASLLPLRHTCDWRCDLWCRHLGHNVHMAPDTCGPLPVPSPLPDLAKVCVCTLRLWSQWRRDSSVLGVEPQWDLAFPQSVLPWPMSYQCFVGKYLARHHCL